MAHAAVIGGGISGLAAAFYLGRRGISCTLVERRARLGGVIRTDRVEGCLVEAGPDGWLAEKSWMLDFVHDLGLADQVMGSQEKYRRTFVVRRGRLVPLPDSMRMLAPSRPWQIASTSLLSPAAKVRMALEWFRKPVEREDRSVAEFTRDHFGSEAVDYLAQPMMSGIYGASPDALSVQQVLPHFVSYEQTYGSILKGLVRDRHRRSRGSLFLTLRDGMGSLVGALQRKVAAHCDFVHDRARALRQAGPGWEIILDRGSLLADAVILAIPAHEAGRLTATVDPGCARLLERIGCLSCTVIGLVYAAEVFDHPLDGFGFLVPATEGGSVAACTWVDRKFEGRSRPDRVLLRAFLTGSAGKWALGADDDAVASRVDRDIRRWMDIDDRPLETRVYRWEKAMPVFAVGHDQVMRRIEAGLARLPGLLLTGNGFAGVGIPDCIRRGQRIADMVSDA